MGALKTCVSGCVAVAVFASGLVVGCGANGEFEFELPMSAVEPVEPTETRVPLPPSQSNEPEDDSEASPFPAFDAGPSDEHVDATASPAKDAGPTQPETGDACTTVDELFKRTCGKCGDQEAICLATHVVSDYGLCVGEKGACIPGETRPCGHCGVQTCSNSCNWGSCTGQPPNSCSPGTVGYSTAGCPAANTYRERSCADTCTWDYYSQQCLSASEPATLHVSDVVGESVRGVYVLSEAKVGKRSPTSCSLSVSSTANYPYELVEVRNDTPQAVTLTIYLAGPTPIETLLAVYATSSPPTTDAALRACSKVNRVCSGVTGCATPWSGVTDVRIPAGGVNYVRFGAYMPLSSTSLSTGMVALHVVTTELH